MTSMKKTNESSKPTDGAKSEFVFGKFNYITMGIGIVFLLIGYILLSGGGSDDPNVFNEAMFDKRRLVAAPVMIVLGFIIEIVAIMVSPKCKKCKNKGEVAETNPTAQRPAIKN